MNASKSTLLRALRGFGYSALLLAVFEACSGDDASTPSPPAGPASVEITGISLGGDGNVLACDYKIGVTVQTTNWTLLPPGRCSSMLQCGQLRVSLLSGSDVLATAVAAANGVALDLRELATGASPIAAGSYAIQVELVDDTGKTYVALDGGNGSTQTGFELVLPADCSSTPSGGGTGGGGGNAGAGGDTSGGAAGDGASGDGASGDGATGASAGAGGAAGAAAG